MAATLKVRRQTENPTLSTDAYLLETTIQLNFMPIQFETTEPRGFVEDGRPNKNDNKIGL